MILSMIRNPASAKKAVEYLEQAIRLDPNFAPAYAHLARAYRASSPPRDFHDYDKVMELINRALELDPDLAEAYAARAEIGLLRDWDFNAVEKDLAKAIAIDPNNDLAHWLSALLSLNRGQFDDALSKIEKARAIDPGAVLYIFHRGRIFYYARRYDEAIAEYQKAIDLDERFMQPFLWMSRLYETKGDYTMAYQYFLKSEERSPRKDLIESYRRVYDSAGWTGLRRYVSDSADFTIFDRARLDSLNGDPDAAFEALNKALERREWHLITLNVEPAFDNLRDDPRFAEFARRVFRN
jgi:tetratricopeptide (TPR) repeat protein